MTDCIEWTGGRTTAGYGVVRVDGKPRYAHRLAYAEAYGPIPEGLHVLHRCDNPPCVNVAHLFVGTDADNVHDMMNKGRHSPPPHRYGEEHHNHRLTRAQARAIRADRRLLREAAADYGISIPTVHSIRTGKTWRSA